MTDVLFIELGVMVTEVKGLSLCTVEPFSNSGPTYEPSRRTEVNLAQAIDHFLPDIVNYDRNLLGSRVAIGPHWPGGDYEGILCVRESFISEESSKGNKILENAADELCAGDFRYRYQVIVSIPEEGEPIKRYHGFHAKVLALSDEPPALKLGILKRNGDLLQNSSGGNVEILYTPENGSAVLYTGTCTDIQFPVNLVNTSAEVGDVGAVFINVAEFTELEDDVPKLPLSAGL